MWTKATKNYTSDHTEEIVSIIDINITSNIYYLQYFQLFTQTIETFRQKQINFGPGACQHHTGDLLVSFLWGVCRVSGSEPGVFQSGPVFMLDC